jgi:hypothetical protein
MKARPTKILALAALSLLLLSCASLPDDYFKQNVGKATQEEVRAKMGDPDHKYTLEDGQTKWVYIVHVSYATYLTYANKDAETCYNYDLIFDQQGILKSWNEVTKSCGTIN